MCDECGCTGTPEQMERLTRAESKLDSWTVDYDPITETYSAKWSPTGIYSRKEAEFRARQRAMLVGGRVGPTIFRTNRRTQRKFPVQ
jgi:hypothetical protein